MEKTEALTALAALAQENRLDVFRLLVEAGPKGLPAGKVAEELRVAPNTLTFHFDRLRTAGLVTVRREGRSMIYAARFESMDALLDYLTANCCGERRRNARPRAAARLPRLKSGSGNARNGTAVQCALSMHRQFGSLGDGRSHLE